MPALVLPPPLRAFAVLFARRFDAILAALIGIVARRFLGHPRLAPLVVPVHRRLQRVRHRLAVLFTRLAAGRTPRHCRVVSRRFAGRRLLFPSTRRCRLIRDLGPFAFEAAACASQLAALLATPQAARLLAALPAARASVASVLRLLGSTPTHPHPPHPPHPATPPPCPPAPLSAPPPLRGPDGRGFRTR
jgi:hypothetical protein